MRLPAAILLLLLAATTSTPAPAQDLEQPWATNIFPTGESGLDSVAAGDMLPLAPTPQELAAPSITTPQTDGLDGCCLPLGNAPCPCFYGEVEALFMKQDPQFARQPIVVDYFTGKTYLSTGDLDFNFDPGLRATVGMRLGACRALEFSYFGLFQSSASASTGTPDPNAFLIFPGNLMGNVFVGMDGAQATYTSWVHSFEMNLTCCCGCCDECGGDRAGNDCGCDAVRCRSFEWFAGFRYIDLGEDLDIAVQRTVSGRLESGAYDIHTTNNLFGAQLGARWRQSWGRFGWEATGKTGLFGNAARETQMVTDFPNFALRPSVSSSGGEVAFVGEINLSAIYRLTNVWNLKAGYNLIWIDGLALAPDQLDFNFATSPNGNQLQNGGAMFLQGVNVGLEARW